MFDDFLNVGDRLRDTRHFGPGGQGGVQRDVSAVASHDLHQE